MIRMRRIYTDFFPDYNSSLVVILTESVHSTKENPRKSAYIRVIRVAINPTSGGAAPIPQHHDGILFLPRSERRTSRVRRLSLHYSLSKPMINKLSPAFLKKFDYLPESLEGKNALVTGGTTGIGRTTALLLAAQGANVIIFGRHEKELNDALNDAKEMGLQDSVRGLVADASKKEDVQKVFGVVDERFGGQLDILINNAAIAFDGLLQGGFEDWQYVLDTNILGYLACAREAVDRMKERGGGQIVNVGSISADTRSKDSTVYAATKAAIQAFSASLRKEVNLLKIKVTLIEPGLVGTDMQKETPEEQRKKEEKLEMLKAEDIAISILFSLIQPKRCDVIVMQVRPHLQEF